jgi:hypothetical protein
VKVFGCNIGIGKISVEYTFYSHRLYSKSLIMPRKRIGFTFDTYQLPLFDFDIRPKGDVIIAIPYSDSGLHITRHASGKMHIRDKFGFDEPMNFDMPNSFETKELKRFIRKMAYNPDHGEDVLVLSYPENYEGYIQQSSNKNVNFDIESILMDTLIGNPVFQVPVETLPRYFQVSPLETHIVIDKTNNSFATYNKGAGIMLNFSMEIVNIQKQMESMPFIKDLMQPIKKAICHTNDLVNQGKVKMQHQNIPKEIESNIDSKLEKQSSKIKIKRFT